MTQLALPYAIPREWSGAAAEAIEMNFRRLFGSSGRLGPDPTTFANGLDTLVPAVGDLISCLAAAGTYENVPIVATVQRVLTNNSGVPTWAVVDLANGVTGLLPFGNIEAVAAARILGSIAGGTIAELTLTEVLDFVGSAAQGDLLYRGASSWDRLAAGTAGYVLQTAGASANPVWGAAVGPGSPLNTKSHLDYEFETSGTFKSDRGSSGTATGTTLAYPAAGSILAAGKYFQLGTAATLNSTAQATSFTSGAFKELSFAWDFDIKFGFYTDAVAITTTLYMIGVGVNNENADPVGANWIGFRYDTGSAAPANTNWVGVTFDGTQSVTGAIGSAVAANTRYVLRIRKVSGTVFFSVNGGAETSTSTNVPVNNVYANIGVRVTALLTAAGSQRSLWFSRLFVDFGT